ncbi:MAG: hypothetical protein JW889_00880 [Verrucomicrobia bacterium]|nr:hypothetical protein [Verrucomicrobiota bacterium]
MNNSSDILEQLTAFIDGELSDDDAREIARTMSTDAQYAQLAHAERATRTLLKSRLIRYSAPPEFTQRLHVALFGDERAMASEQRLVAPKRGTFAWLFGWNPATASALGAVVFVAALSFVILTFSGDRIGPYLADVYAHHADPDAFPIEHTGSRQTVADSISEAVGFDVAVPDLSPRASLEGARKCTLCGHRIAYIKYRRELGRISLFIIPKERLAIWRLDRLEHDSMTFYTAAHEGVRMAFWHEDGMTYCLAAALAEDELIGLACTACRQVRYARANGAHVAPAYGMAAVHGTMLAATQQPLREF